MKVAFLHPELGVGGAERLVVNAAVALQRRGHHVTLFTAQHDPARCFDPTRDGTLDVRVHGRRLPLQIGGRLRLPAAIARMLAVGRPAISRSRQFDVIFCDAVAQVIPLLRLRTRVPIVFYCHFPDLLLTPPRTGWYRWYRVPFDRWEAAATEMADRVFVNSRFTAAALRGAFPRLRAVPEVLHPGVDVDRHTDPAASSPGASSSIVAVSRFSPDKNLLLALEAYAHLRQMMPAPAFAATRLVIAGAEDSRLRESRDTGDALQRRSEALGLGAQVVLRRSPTDAELRALLERARCVVYTPACEHFGLVPLEAMAAGRPVLAANDGGPLETVVEGETGFLRPARPDTFAEAMHRLFVAPDLADRLGRAGRARVEREFSLSAFGARLEAQLQSIVQPLQQDGQTQ